MDRILELIDSTNPDDVMLGIILGLKERDKEWWMNLTNQNPTMFDMRRNFDCKITSEYCGKFLKSSITGIIIYLTADGDCITYDKYNEAKITGYILI